MVTNSTAHSCVGRNLAAGASTCGAFNVRRFVSGDSGVQGNERGAQEQWTDEQPLTIMNHHYKHPRASGPDTIHYHTPWYVTDKSLFILSSPTHAGAAAFKPFYEYFTKDIFEIFDSNGKN